MREADGTAEWKWRHNHEMSLKSVRWSLQFTMHPGLFVAFEIFSMLNKIEYCSNRSCFWFSSLISGLLRYFLCILLTTLTFVTVCNTVCNNYCDSSDCWCLVRREEMRHTCYLFFQRNCWFDSWCCCLGMRTEMMTVDGWGLLGLLTGNYDWSGLAIDTFRQTLQYQMWRMNYHDSSVPSVPLNLYLIELFNCTGYKIQEIVIPVVWQQNFLPFLVF